MLRYRHSHDQVQSQHAQVQSQPCSGTVTVMIRYSHSMLRYSHSHAEVRLQHICNLTRPDLT
jgi:hypothetical protein